MALNKPKYTLWNNARYAINGLIEVIRNESSFKLQLLVFILMSTAAWLLPISTGYKMILNISLFIPIMAELANSSIERVVDLVTLEYHELAKRAKDAGAALVFISLIVTGAVWLSVLLLAFELV
jgi:diacylglycerol kinase (ATP)